MTAVVVMNIVLVIPQNRELDVRAIRLKVSKDFKGLAYRDFAIVVR